jgi:hypothetical protein
LTCFSLPVFMKKGFAVLCTITFYGALCYLLLPHGRALGYLYFVCPEVVRGSKSLQIVGTYHYAQEHRTN